MVLEGDGEPARLSVAGEHYRLPLHTTVAETRRSIEIS